ncbi:type II/IV secretion system protein [Anaerococcus vaginalis]|uniref:Type II/IV secretion system protein n=2 Tax=Anaerococcus vaginalis TaxID=33037 RepID=C7HSR4_9FIRM|nr:GspE/PulE family protein [Anaerococcus vaginalis]EEU13180.1 type II/IV secretion system protein [Anaerococcus vaginalis ATCC 51170]QQB62383.1 type II/IV secretion system protein [Anaerococcus vaginalis]
MDNDLINSNIDLYINELVEKALKLNASDIHIEPMDEKFSRIRFRIDGKLRIISEMDYPSYIKLLTRIKLSSKLDISEKRRPQDGYLKLEKFPEIDFRISTLNTIVGEKLVLRILSIENFKKSQNLLGFSDDSKKILENAIKNKSGMIIFSGPTGSGKSTSLYSLLNKLNDEKRNIISIENPVEINILGINQISINEKIGLTFQNALRSILRQDPDIIMLGEIRDKETAKMAVRAAITGHLVLTTLHTNNSFASINRLRDLGVEDYLIKQSVNTLASQRLVRKLCSCKKKRKISKKEYDFVKNYFDIDENTYIYEASSCDKCHDGYLGREAVEEIVDFDEAYKKLFFENKNFNKNDLDILNKEKNFKSMTYNGIKKVLDGVTSFEEILDSIYYFN